MLYEILQQLYAQREVLTGFPECALHPGAGANGPGGVDRTGCLGHVLLPHLAQPKSCKNFLGSGPSEFLV